MNFYPTFTKTSSSAYKNYRKSIKNTKKLKKNKTRYSVENGRHELQKQMNYNDVRLRGVTFNKKRYVCMIY